MSSHALTPPLSPFLLQAASSADHQSAQMALFSPITALREHGLTHPSGLQEAEVAAQDPVSFWPCSQFPRGLSPELLGPPLLLEAERATYTVSAEVQQLCPLLSYMCLWHSPVGTFQGTVLTGTWVLRTCHLHSWGSPHMGI